MMLPLTRLNKRKFYQSYLGRNISNMKRTWEGINNLINKKKRKEKIIHRLKKLDENIFFLISQKYRHSQQTFCNTRSSTCFKNTTLFYPFFTIFAPTRNVNVIRVLLLNSLPINPCVSILALLLMDF